MKIIVDIEEFWTEEDGENLSVSLKHSVKGAVISEIQTRIKSQVDKEITEKCTAFIQDKLSKLIESKLTEIFATETIRVNSQEILIADHVKSLFDRNHGWNSPNEIMKKIADNFCKELKAQYNNVFATKIVLSLKDQGMLKEDVAKLLLQDSK